MNKVIPLIAFSLLLLVPVGSQNAFAGPGGFSGDYDPTNWTFSTEGNGEVFTGFAPAEITLRGSDEFGLPCEFDSDMNCLTAYQVPILCAGAGIVNFGWDYGTADEDGPSHDPMGYLINGDATQLSDNDGLDNQSGSESVPVQSGDLFGFYIEASDNNFGGASAIFSEFSVICNGAEEVCDGMDNDGDNMIDEGFNVGQDCEAGVGACFALGNFVCTQDGQGTECDAVQGSPSAEVCDGLDNDCDGSVDDNLMCNGLPPTVGGERIPIETTSLLLANAQTFSWMIPVVLSGIGIGLFVVSRKSE